ncbi:MAG: [ribosomal protein S5]-alanine N-acetyltransferase [Acidobacteriota bacterium]|nr:[ribosomal protein S5]-alanine N-acetyltransferase [Acidobacteriota bacterium]
MKNLRYHHIGIPNVIRRDREDYFAPAKMFHTNFDDNPYGIEWLRFEPGSSLPGLVREYPHIAFKVDNLDAALEGKEILIQPNSPSEGVRVAFVVHNGAPVEFLEYDESQQVVNFPQIETQRLVLRQIRSEDAEDLWKLRNNSQIMEFMDISPMKSVREAWEQINYISRNFIEEQIPIWAITLKEDSHTDTKNKMIGYVGYTGWNKKHYRAEIAYVLEPAFWRRGFMTEAIEAVLKMGFGQMYLHSVEANVNPTNIASIKILEKFNFRREAYYKENFYFDGKFVDTAIYSLLKQDFPGPRL